MCIEFNELLNSFGLLIDIVGAFLIFRFGLPPRLKTGTISMGITADGPYKPTSKEIRYDELSRLGLLLLIIGFVFQLVSNFI